MTMYNPINTNGFQYYTQSAQGAGWYQINGPSPSIPVLTGITIPNEATAVLVQAVVATRFCLSPTSTAAAGANCMLVPAGKTLWLPGRVSIYQLCMLLTASGGKCVFQFYTGSGDGGPTLV